MTPNNEKLPPEDDVEFEVRVPPQVWQRAVEGAFDPEAPVRPELVPVEESYVEGDPPDSSEELDITADSSFDDDADPGPPQNYFCEDEPDFDESGFV
ncbi:hypothetical protein [Rhodococcus indonesiensis]